MPKKRWSMYVHPWDIIDEGIDKTLQFLSNSGISTINIASSYHTGRYILPHNPKKKIYIAEEGTVYFKPNYDYFKNSRIKPRVSRNYESHDILKELLERAQSYNMNVSSWTVFLHNSVFTNEYPDLAIVDPFGNRDGNFLCPNRNETRNYMASLSANIADYGIRTIQMESYGYPNGLNHGNHHEIFGVKVDPTVSYLFTLCYCKQCKRKALDMGLNLDEKLPSIRNLISVSLNSDDSPSYDIPLEEKIMMDLKKFDLEKLIEFKQLTVNEVIGSIRERLKETVTNCNIEVIVNPETCLNEGMSFENPPFGISGIDMITYYPEINNITNKIEWAIKLLKKKINLFPCIRITYPMIKSEEQLRKTVDAIDKLNIQGVNFYNYGWAPEQTLKNLSSALTKFL